MRAAVEMQKLTTFCSSVRRGGEGMGDSIRCDLERISGDAFSDPECIILQILHAITLDLLSPYSALDSCYIWINFSFFKSTLFASDFD